MARIIKKMPSPQGVAAGQTATINLPLGLTYYQLQIRMQYDNAGTPTDVPVNAWGTYLGDIRLLVDGNAKIDISAAELATIIDYYGQSRKAGVLPIFLARPWMRIVQGEDALAYGTEDVQSLSLEMDVKSGVTVSKLEVTAVQGMNEPLGQHFTLRRYTVPQTVTGLREVSEIRRGPYGILAMHLATAGVDKFSIEANQRVILEQDRALMEAYVEQTGRVIQAGWTHVDFAPTDRLADTFGMQLQDFRAIFDFTATGNFNLFTENVETHKPV